MRKAVQILLLLCPGLYAGTLIVENDTSVSSVFSNTLMLLRNDIGKELQDPMDFAGWFPPPPGYTRFLNAYSKPYGTILGMDARPKSSITPISVHLAVAGGTITQADNTLKFQVTAADGFEHRVIKAQQVSPAVGAVHTIPKDGSTYAITLPNLVNQPTGVYAVWVITVDRILQGDIVEDGKVDLQDFAKLASEWLMTSSETVNGGNYLVSDHYLNRLTDLEDLMGIANSWMEVE